MSRLRSTLPVSILLLSSTLAGLAQAQTPIARPTPLPALGRSVVGNPDSSAIVQNPANLAFLPGPEFRWSGYFLGDAAEVPTAGHAFAFALPFGFIPVATGIRFDMVTPPSTASQAMFGSPVQYQWLTWAIAAGSEFASLGLSFERSFSNNVQAHGFGSWSAGISLRPAAYVGFSGFIKNLDAPTSQGGLQLGAEYVMASAIRPLGSDQLEIGIETSYVDESGGYWVPRATLDVGIPGLGRLRGDLAITDAANQQGEAAWIASTALVVTGNTRQGSGELALGARYGDGLGAASAERPWENLSADVAVRGFQENFAADNMHYAIRVRIEKTPSVREHVALLRTLWSYAEKEDNLMAVLLELRATPAGSLAHLQELQDALLLLRQKGKKILCHMESASGAGLVLCSEAERVLISPAGGILYSGLKSQSFYVKDLLDKLGVKTDFVRIGKYKAAPETFARREATAPALEVKTSIMQEVERELHGSLARGRKLDLETVRKTIANGPFTAAEAKKANLVDGFAFDDMLPKAVDDLAGESLPLEKGHSAPTRPSRFGPQKRLALVYVEGDMVDGRSKSFPFLGMRSVGSYTIAETLQELRRDPNVGAIVIRVESGGGSAVAADVIWREVQLTAAKKPVVISMGTAAASGAYYLASAGTYIYANPLTITGSIGVFAGKIDLSGLLSKIGVNVETLKTGEHADAETMFRPFSEEERRLLENKVEQFYALFVRRVADSRRMSQKDVDAVARGRVWTGRQALEHRLVDGMGGLRQALAKARVLGGLSDDAPIVELPIPQSTLLGRLLGVEGLRAEIAKAQQPLPGELMEMVRAVAPLSLYAPELPLARLEWQPDLVP
jgi:protease-4